MPTWPAWKAFEKRIAEIFGGARRGVDTSREGRGRSDIVHDHYSIECKLLSRPNYQQLLDACKQAESAADHELQMPVAVVKRKRDQDQNALVIMRLETYRSWYLDWPSRTRNAGGSSKDHPAEEDPVSV